MKILQNKQKKGWRFLTENFIVMISRLWNLLYKASLKRKWLFIQFLGK